MDKVIAEAAQYKPRFKVLGSKLWAFFNSLTLTISLLITLAVVSIIGTVIQQGQSIDTYLAEYGTEWTRIILFLNFNDMYHSTWFTAILVMVAVNIVVCTLERFPAKWRTLLRAKPSFDPGIIEKLSNRDSFIVQGSTGTVVEGLTRVFKKKGYRVLPLDTEGDPPLFLHAWKGKIGRFGSDLTHLSLLLILLGAIVGSLFGYRDFRAIPLGEKAEIPETEYEIRLDNFWIDYYDTGQIKQFNSNLVVVKTGEDVFAKHIWVNEPLHYEGIRYYQSSYGMLWDRIAEAYIHAVKKGEKREPVGSPVNAKWGELKGLPGTPYSVKVVGYAADFAYDDELGRVVSQSAETNNPAVRLEVYEQDKIVSTPWLFFNYPGIFPAIPGSDYDLILTGFRPIPYSGIAITKDPGTNIVWAGSIIMGFGFIFAFFVNYKRVWVKIKRSPEGCEVTLGGMINKNQLIFEKEFKELAKAARGGCGSEVER
jgi:cytochrome c biogenesis protein